MPKSQNQAPAKKKCIKNIYIHKINSLLKIVGDEHSSLPCLNKARKAIFSDSLDGLMQQRKQNSKDAARKARMRKRMYMELLEKTIENLKQLNDEGMKLEKASVELLESIQPIKSIKQSNNIEDEIDEYISNFPRNHVSQVTIDSEKGTDLNKVLMEIQMMTMPNKLDLSRLKQLLTNLETHRLMSKIEAIQQQLPQLFSELKKTCSDHNSLLALSSSFKKQQLYDPYFWKTLMEQYYSKTICKKEVPDVETTKPLGVLTRMERYEHRCSEIVECNILLNQQ